MASLPRRLGALVLALAIPLAAAAEPARRVVSLDGAATEIAFLIGKGGDLVATDLTSRFPDAAARLPKVGYVRALTAEGVIAQRPDLVIMPPDAGPKAVIEQLATAGLNLVRLPDSPSADGVGEKIRAVAATLGAADAGEALAGQVKARFEQVAALVGTTTTKPRVLFLLDIGKGAPLAGGTHTSADAMIDMAGGINVATAIKGFRPMSPEAIVAAAPDFVLMMSHVVDGLGGTDTVAAIEPVSLTPAGKGRHVIAMDGQFLLGFGPRTPDAVETLARTIHPELGKP